MPQSSMLEELRERIPERVALITEATRRANELMDFLIEHNIGPGRIELPGKAGELLWSGDRTKR